MPSKSFSYSSVLGFGWRVMTANFWFFVGVGGILFLVSMLGQIPGAIMQRCPGVIPPFLFFLLLGVLFVIQTILGIGLIKITLSFCDGQKPGLSTLFNGMDCFWRYIGTGLLYGLILAGASAVCILPLTLLSVVIRQPCFLASACFVILILVIILAIKFSLCFYFVVDRGLGPINALKASSLATAGAKGSLFIFGILCSLIHILGILCLFVGVFATFPIIMVAMTLVYRLLLEQTPELAKPGSGTQLESTVGSSQTVQLGQGVHFDPGVQPGQARRVAPVIQLEEQSKGKGDKTFVFWLIVLVILGAVMAWGAVCRLWPKSKTKSGPAITSKAAVVPAHKAKAAAVSTKKVTYSPNEIQLTGILYSEDKSSAIINGEIVKEGDTINGAKVIKIHADGVELERDGVKWTQQSQ